VFFRALHTVSTQRYRLPVRRYILDLFTTELDGDLVVELSECATSLRAPPTFKQSEAHMNRVVSMFGLKHARGTNSESDDEDDDDMDDDANEVMNDRNPVIQLRPVSRIIGFDK